MLWHMVLDIYVAEDISNPKTKDTRVAAARASLKSSFFAVAIWDVGAKFHADDTGKYHLRENGCPSKSHDHRNQVLEF